MRKSVVIAVLLAAMVCTSAAWCQGPPPGGPGGAGGRGGPGGMRGMALPCQMTATMPPGIGMLGHLADVLQLGDDQIAKLKDVLTAAGEAMRPRMQKVGDLCKALREALIAEKYDAANVTALTTQAKTAEADVVTANIDVWTQIRDKLTPDQLAKLAEAMTPPQGPPGGPGGPPPGGPPPGGPPPGGPPPAE